MSPFSDIAVNVWVDCAFAAVFCAKKKFLSFFNQIYDEGDWFIYC